MSEHLCPRRDEGPVPSMAPKIDTWREDGTCSYCGSLNPDELMARLEAGTVGLGPTDKNYKVYVQNLGGAVFKQTYGQEKRGHKFPDTCPLCEAPTEKIGLVQWCDTCDYLCFGGEPGGNCAKCKTPLRSGPTKARCSPCGATFEAPREIVTREVQETKFYFQHLSEAQKTRFVDMLNERKIKIGVPGYFYVRPFFVSVSEKKT